MNKSIDTISPLQLHHMLSDGEDINLIDVRAADEYRRGHVAFARLITLDDNRGQTTINFFSMAYLR